MVAGFNTCGNVYTTEMCINNICKIVLVHSITNINSDSLLMGQTIGAGFIGLGAKSQVWVGLLDPETNTATYSISLS